MSKSANTTTETVGVPHPKEGQDVVIQIHSNLINQRQLSNRLDEVCKMVSFRVEMRHNVYMIYLNRKDKDLLVSRLVTILQTNK